MANKYNLKHVRCNMEDFNADRHRFRFWYKKPDERYADQYIASCYNNVDILFDTDLPDDVKSEISEIIWDKIDKNKMKWSYPRKAYEIADQYCAETFA